MDNIKCSINKNEPDATEIIPNVWLGNYRSAISSNFIKKYNIQYIINATKDVPCVFPHIQYLKIEVSDDDTCYKNIAHIFNESVDLIYKAIKERKNILIHCKRGHHRSASLVAAFLMKHMKLNYVDALAYINSRRPCALIRNTCMVKALFDFYTNLSLQTE